MKEIDLKSIFVLLLSRLRWIVAGVVILALLFGGYSHFFVDEQYTSTAKIYVRNTKEEYIQSDKYNGTTTGNLTAAQQLVNNYTIFLKTKPVLEEATKQLGDKLTVGELSAAADASGMDETSWLNLSVTLNDKKLVKEACQVLAEVSAKRFSDLDNIDVKVCDVTDASKTAPNAVKSAIIGGLLGLVLTVGVILIRQFTNNTIRDKYDLVAHLDVPVLGEIPSFEFAKKKTAKGGRTHA